MDLHGHAARGAQGTLLEQAAQAAQGVPVAEGVGDHAHQAGAGAGLDHALRFGDVHGQRLLAEHVLAGRQGRDGGRGVQGVRAGDGHCVDVRPSQQLAVVGVDVRDTATRGQRRDAPAVAGAEGDDPGTRMRLDAGDVAHLREVPGADDPDPYRLPLHRILPVHTCAGVVARAASLVLLRVALPRHGGRASAVPQALTPVRAIPWMK